MFQCRRYLLVGSFIFLPHPFISRLHHLEVGSFPKIAKTIPPGLAIDFFGKQYLLCLNIKKSHPNGGVFIIFLVARQKGITLLHLSAHAFRFQVAIVPDSTWCRKLFHENTPDTRFFFETRKCSYTLFPNVSLISK